MKTVQKNIQPQRQWAKAFREVMDAFYEARSVHGSSPAFNYATLANDGGKATCTFRRQVKVSISDFLVDVEMAARSSMENPMEWEFFKRAYLDVKPYEVNELNRELDKKLEEKIGRKFMVRQIYPLTEYFRTRNL